METRINHNKKNQYNIGIIIPVIMTLALFAVMIKAIVVSGYSGTYDMRETLKMGAGRFINKPYTIEDLGKAVRDELS